jgi:amino acid adenylation domain-containing protein
MNPQHPIPRVQIKPVNPFTRFRDEEIEQSIPERFEKQVRAYGHRLAIKSDEASFSFDDLNQTANKLARRIMYRRGDQVEPIALLFDHGAGVIAAMLGVLKAAKFYLVLDPTYPHDRLMQMLEDSGARLIVADSQNLALARDLCHEATEIVNFNDPSENPSGVNLGTYPAPEQLAMILYTSGSTGRPKGVMHTHRNVLVDARNLTNEWCINAQDRWLLHTSASFANSVRTIYGSLVNGASVYPYDAKKKGFGQLSSWLLSNEITILRSVPTTFRHFMSTVPESQKFPAVRVLSVGGEPMFRADVDYFNRHFLPPCVLVHALGPTECLTVCWSCIPHGTRIAASKLPIGYPLKDKDVLVLDEGGRELGEGEVGEIAVKSRYISPGYWRDPERTKSVFSPDPLESDKRIYLTGDLGMRLQGGCLVHIGRRDFQAKIRGFRVDVSEIEIALRAIDGIDDAIVVSRAETSGENRLIAYFVPKTKPPVTVTQIRQSLTRVLPDYMIPAAFVRLDAIPKNPNGKTDRLNLPLPPRERPDLPISFASPKTFADKELAQIWAEALDLEAVGINDNFFELGGNSLLAARAFVEIEKRFGRSLPLSSIFRAPTIEQLASLIDSSIPSNGSSSLVAIQPRGSKPPFFCVHELFGDVLCYLDLSRHLGDDQPFYALQPRGLDGAQEPCADIEAIAAHYIEEIRNIQPRGPYALGGLCFGGTVAFEMAQQLLSKGEPVSLVALLDSNLTSKQDRIAWWCSFLRNLPRGFPAWLVGASQLNSAQWSTLVKQKISMTQAGIRDALGSSANGSQQDNTPVRIRELGDFFQFSKQHRKVAQAQHRAFGEYKPRPYPGRLTLFRARMQPLFSSHAPDSGWEWLAAGGLDIRVVPGNHLGMLQEPHVQVLAQQLRDCLGRV